MYYYDGGMYNVQVRVETCQVTFPANSLTCKLFQILSSIPILFVLFSFFLMYKNNSFGRNYKNFNKNKPIIYSYIFVSRPAKHIKELQNISPAIAYYTCKKVIVEAVKRHFPEFSESQNESIIIIIFY